VEKALRLLSTFSLASPQWALSDLAREQGMPKSTAHNLLKTLQAFDLIRQDPEDRVYRLGPRALEMGFLYARSTELLGQARPHLRRLAERSRETVKLGMLSDSQVLIVAAVESTHQLHTRGDIGQRGSAAMRWTGRRTRRGCGAWRRRLWTRCAGRWRR